MLWREGEGGLEVAVVHRPRYGDWSLPKGKRSGREAPLETARREVAEETGQATRAGADLGEVRYRVRTSDGSAADKTVRYWAMEALGGAFRPSEEVDDLRWVAPADAVALLTYEQDRAVVERFLERT